MSRIKLYPAFEHWQERGNIVVFSDSHFGDSDCELMDSSWLSPSDHTKKILHNLHSNDTLVCLGDVGDPSYMKWIYSRRNHLHSILITGNHDAGVSKYTDYFDEVYSGAVMIAPQIVLSHEPIYLPFAVNIHGHNHDGLMFEFDEDGICGVNLAANVMGYGAWNLNDNVNEGLLKSRPTIHRITIEKAISKNEETY